jgi:uncharacterized protein YjbI with pentapeptide repeats
VRGPDWPTCAIDECVGAVSQGRRCLGHLDRADRAEAFTAWLDQPEIDVRGLRIDSALLDDILVAFGAAKSWAGSGEAPLVRFDGARFTTNVSFDNIRFAGGVTFDEAHFTGDVRFGGVFFAGSTRFDRVEFDGLAAFDGTRFAGHYTRFDEARFHKTARFVQAVFDQNVWFNDVEFGGHLMFNGARFLGDLSVNGARFMGAARFNSATFAALAWFKRARFLGERTCFDGAEFAGSARFDDTVFGGDVSFAETRFAGAQVIGPVTATGRFDFDDAVFERAVRMEVDAAELTCRNVRFDDIAELQVRRAVVVCDGAAPSARLTIAAPPCQASAELPGPRLRSLNGVDTEKLVLNNVDLSGCLFAGARQLDRIRIGGYDAFARTPYSGRWRWGWSAGRVWPGVWRWSARRTLADEHLWRSTTRKRQGWTGLDGTAALGPERIAVLYRELRKAHEDRADQPGAADFYYGEMEMRRHSRTTPFSERLVLAAYWAVSGYGLRASRALLALLGVVMIAAFLLQHFGFPPPTQPGYLASLLYSASATLSLDLKVAGFPETISEAGQVVRILLRVSGPLCLGLAALALRGRVKR